MLSPIVDLYSPVYTRGGVEEAVLFIKVKKQIKEFLKEYTIILGGGQAD